MTDELVTTAEETRQFRNLAAPSYDRFDSPRAQPAVAAARLLANELPTAIAGFRQAIDP